MPMSPAELEMIKTGFEQINRGQEAIVAAQNRLFDGQAGLHDRLDHLDECFDSLKDEVKSHIKKQDNQYKELREMMQSIVPNGDFDGHRNYHIKEMNRWQFVQRLKGSAITEMVKWASIGAAGWVILTLWGGFKIVVNT